MCFGFFEGLSLYRQSQLECIVIGSLIALIHIAEHSLIFCLILFRSANYIEIYTILEMYDTTKSCFKPCVCLAESCTLGKVAIIVLDLVSK
jgi:formylmethanofuran dehydrogenase subunit E